MVKLVLLIFILAFGIFLYLKNKQENRRVDRHNRLAEKQEELIEMLSRKKETEY